MAELKLLANVDDKTNKINYRAGTITATTGPGEDGSSITTSTGEGEETFQAQIGAGFGPGVLLLENRDPTNAIDIGFETAKLHIRLDKAGSDEGVNRLVLNLEPSLLSFFHKAVAGTPQLFWKLYERSV